MTWGLRFKSHQVQYIFALFGHFRKFFLLSYPSLHRLGWVWKEENRGKTFKMAKKCKKCPAHGEIRTAVPQSSHFTEKITGIWFPWQYYLPWCPAEIRLLIIICTWAPRIKFTCLRTGHAIQNWCRNRPRFPRIRTRFDAFHMSNECGSQNWGMGSRVHVSATYAMGSEGGKLLFLWFAFLSIVLLVMDVRLNK